MPWTLDLTMTVPHTLEVLVALSVAQLAVSLWALWHVRTPKSPHGPVR